MRQARPTANLNPNSTDLQYILEGVHQVYVYPHHRIELVDGELHQTRSGPNWEGSMLTLTTCKHHLRTYSSVREGNGITALCGVTNKLEGSNYLMYLGVIDEMFSNNASLGKYLKHYFPKTYYDKLATTNSLGDIYEWTGEGAGNNVEDYVPPEGHVRYEEYSKGERKWVKDITYRSTNGKKQKRPKCLTLNPTTVHYHPTFRWTGRLGRSGVVVTPEEFLQQMECLI